MAGSIALIKRVSPACHVELNTFLCLLLHPSVVLAGHYSTDGRGDDDSEGGGGGGSRGAASSPVIEDDDDVDEEEDHVGQGSGVV